MTCIHVSGEKEIKKGGEGNFCISHCLDSEMANLPTAMV